MATQTLLTLEQFLELPEQEGLRRELDEGRVIEMSPPSYVHARVVARVAHLLEAWAEQAEGNWQVALGSGFVLEPATMRIPDVFLTRKEAVDSLPVLKGAALQGAPELSVEVVSPSDTAYRLDRSIHQYLKAGTRVVWVIYPESRRVVVHRNEGGISEYGSGEVVAEPELLPGLRIDVNSIFAGV
jgi:Uma2 family endonuclease